MTTGQTLASLLIAVVLAVSLNFQLPIHAFLVSVLGYSVVFFLAITLLLLARKSRKEGTLARMTAYYLLAIFLGAGSLSIYAKTIFDEQMAGCNPVHWPSYRFNMLTMQCEYYRGHPCSGAIPWYRHFRCQSPGEHDAIQERGVDDSANTI